MNSKHITLKDTAYEKIKEKILNSAYEHWSEISLVKELNMSRTPIREALQKLEHEGFLKLLPNQGISIQELSINETNEILDFRIAIETASLKLAVHLLTQDDFDVLEGLIEGQIHAVNDNLLFKFIEYDFKFHLQLLRVVGNEMFIQGGENVTERLLKLNRGRIKYIEPKLAAIIQEHIRLVNFLKNKDIISAVNELENHLNSGKIKVYGGV